MGTGTYGCGASRVGLLDTVLSASSEQRTGTVYEKWDLLVVANILPISATFSTRLSVPATDLSPSDEQPSPKFTNVSGQSSRSDDRSSPNAVAVWWARAKLTVTRSRPRFESSHHLDRCEDLRRGRSGAVILRRLFCTGQTLAT